jgi:glucose-1-phosphate thymidylyltransferase
MPAAGRARRLGDSAGSKEITVIGSAGDAGGRQRPLLVCENLLTAFRLAGARRTIVLRREEKLDIERTLGDGSRFGLALEYLVIPPTLSVPETFDHAWNVVSDADVAVGFPDVLAEPAGGLADAVNRRRAGGADVVLALYPTDRPGKCDMVELDSGGGVHRIEVKPERTALTLTWLFATWGPRFTAFLHQTVATAHRPVERELALSDVLTSALAAGFAVEAVAFAEGSHLDVGTKDDLDRARERFALRPNGG